MIEDPSGFVEWAVQIFVGLFSLFLILCLVLLAWQWLIAAPVRWLRRRGKSVHHDLAKALPIVPLADPRGELRAQIGSYEEVSRELARRLRERSREVILRDPGEMTEPGKALARLVFDRWQAAGGRVPRLRRELPGESWNFPLDPVEFVTEWNESTWLHSAEHPKLRIEDLAAGPFMSGPEFVDWQLEEWARQLERQVSLNCCDIGCVPFFLAVPLAMGLANVLPLWAAIPLALLPVVPFMLGWRWLRRRAYITFGDD